MQEVSQIFIQTTYGLILVPTANYEEASVFADDNTEIVAVDSFDNALNVIFDFSSR